MDVISYLNFDLLLSRVAGGYQARLVSGPAGEVAVTFALPFSDLELENFVLRIGRTRQGLRGPEVQQIELIRAFGSKLFTTVFAGELKEAFARSIDLARQQGKGLRLRLRMQDVPELADIPWEYLYDPSAGRFLAVSFESPIVRYLELAEPIRPLQIAPPLNLLVLTATPKDYPDLDVDREWQNLRSALDDLVARGLVTVDRLQQPTPGGLQIALRRKQYHVLHFVGHSAFDVSRQSGIILLEDETGRSQAVSGENLSDLLHDARTLRLVVLNACEGARTSRTDPFSGVAQSLIKKSIPAVIAMQFDITDRASVTFTREFYGALADGYPVDAALAETRKAMKAQNHEVEWGTPVLYMRAPDGRIFDIEPGTSQSISPAAAAPINLPANQSRRYRFLIPILLFLIAGGSYLATRLLPGTPPSASVTPTTQVVTSEPALPDAALADLTPPTLDPAKSPLQASLQTPQGTLTPTPGSQAGIITYIRNAEGAKTLYALGSAGAPVALTEPATDIAVLAISPDRQYLAVAFSMIGPMTRPQTRPGFVAGNPVNLQVVSTDGATRQTIVSKVIGLSASYAADGKLLIAALIKKDSLGQSIIYYLADRDGSQLRQLNRTEEILIQQSATQVPLVAPARGGTP